MTDATRERLRNLVDLLRDNPRGLTTPEIASRMGTTRQTARRDIERLEADGVPIIRIEETHRYTIDKNYYKRIDLSLAQAWYLYLPLRRMVRANQHRFPFVRKLFHQISYLLHPDIAEQLEMEQAANPDTKDDWIFTTLVESWDTNRYVDLRYRRPNATQTTQFIFAPWWFEPAVWSEALYVIGGARDVHRRHTQMALKLERIRSVYLREETFERPDTGRIVDGLVRTWGIWVGEGEAVQVVLRFDGRQEDRLRETQWHPSQTITLTDDGSVIWEAYVSEPKEMVPWIRGWGSDVEVLAPASLRKAVMREVQHMLRVYNLNGTNSRPPSELLWAKVEKSTDEMHLLIYHLIDVALVALAMWNDCLSNSMKEQIANLLNLDTEAAGRLIAFWVGLHDMGKASPAFQVKYQPAVSALSSAGLTFSNQIPNVPHGIISAFTLPVLLELETGLDKVLARNIAHALGGHHGEWPIVDQLIRNNKMQRASGGADWDQARQELFGILFDVLVPPDAIELTLSQEEENALWAILSGFTSVADWIGSMSEFFPYEDMPIAIDEYVDQASGQADEALYRLGWKGWRSQGHVQTFNQLFPELPGPNYVQQEIVAVADDTTTPCLVILEAPTGTGKTEAALYLADHWLQSAHGRGLYIAMPTQATSNQMFSRVLRFLQQRYPNELVNVHLLHSQAQWIDEAQEINLKYVDEDAGEGTLAAMRWFQPRKRSLLAPFGVGTVDQALMSILRTKHFFVRLFGLSNKIVIFDEVHAYDTYMSQLFHRLLKWLRQLNTSVIILSATLPQQTRDELVRCHVGEENTQLLTTSKPDYPRLTVADTTQVTEIRLNASESRTIALDWVEREPHAIASHLMYELSEGGCAVVICNTVRRSQEIYTILAQADIVSPEHLILFHAQYPFVWRNETERKVLDMFSKHGNRPERAILVATQVVEQSLDLDFDVMVTDIAPIDLLLQRVGRLHRHERAYRPPKLMYSRLLLTEPQVAEGIPFFENDAYVYNEYILLITTLLLQDRGQITLPEETTELIESIYGDTSWLVDYEVSLQDAIREARSRMEQGFREAEFEAQRRLILSPEEDGLLRRTFAELEEENPGIHPVFQAMTRLIDPGISLVCLHRNPRGISLEPGEYVPIDPTSSDLSREEMKQLLQRTITVRHRGVAHALLGQPVPASWSSIPYLQDHRLVVFQEGRYPVAGTSYVMYLTRRLGLEIRKEAE